MDKRSYEERLELYFERAVQAWILLRDEGGLVAALAAAKTFNSVDRQIIIAVIDSLSTQWTREEDEFVKEFIKSLDELKEIITARDWTLEDGIAERNRLKMVNPEFEAALVKGDPDVFARKYPKYFKMFSK